MSYLSTLTLTPLLEGVAALTEDQGAYGSFSGAGYLVVNRTTRATISEYSRWLDMDRAVVVSKWKEGGVWISRYASISKDL
jgi:alpha-L-fucosidase 2